MNFLLEEIGTSAFSKFRVEKESLRRMSTFNAAVYDAVAVGLANSFSPIQVKENPKQIARKMEGFQQVLFRNPEFFSSVSGSVNDAAKVVTRIEAMNEYLVR